MKEIILDRFNGRYCSINDIVDFVNSQNIDVSRKTIIWTVNDLVHKGIIARSGRGIYNFKLKPLFDIQITDDVKRLCSFINSKFKYLTVAVTDSEALGQFMNLQPFSTVIVIEVMKDAIDSVVSALRKENFDAYAKSDYSLIERYVTSSKPIVVRRELKVNPTLFKLDNVCISTLEKMLVDIVCDDDIFGQYQDVELQNIYQNASEDYSVNFSQMIKYASARNRKPEVISMLEETSAYQSVKGLL